MEVASTSSHAGLEDTGCWAPGACSRESRTRSSAEGAGHDRRSVSPALARWIAEIQRVWAQSGTRTLELARVVNVARGRLPYGQWTALWTSGQMPFSKRKAEMLVVVGARLDWMDAQTFAHLPRGWSILYCLARLKTYVRYVALLAAAGAFTIKTPAAPAVIESGPHHTAWPDVNVGVDDQGQPAWVTNSWTEVATGLNFWSPPVICRAALDWFWLRTSLVVVSTHR